MATYQLISSVTVGSGGASSIDFTSIPATYTDLKVVISARSVKTGQVYDQIQITFNGTNSGSWRNLTGDGASVTNESQTSKTYIKITPGVAASATANTFSNDEVYIPNYAGSNNKSLSADSVGENNATTAYAVLTAGLNSSATAISSITLKNESTSNFAQYSTAYLYGIKNS